MTDSETFTPSGVPPLTEEQITNFLKSAESVLRRIPGTKIVRTADGVFEETGAVMRVACTPSGFTFEFSNTINPLPST